MSVKGRKAFHDELTVGVSVEKADRPINLFRKDQRARWMSYACNHCWSFWSRAQRLTSGALQSGSRRYRTIFISDVHLGTKGCQSRLLLDFLRDCHAGTIYLVGDIVDAWRLKQVWHWPQEHNDVVQKLLRQVRKGVRVIYIPGNHDEFLKSYLGAHFGGVEVAESAIHVGLDGRRYLVVHGDAFDVVVRHARWIALLGDWAYETALVMNTGINAVRRSLGLSYWSLSQWAKLKVKGAVNFIGNYELALVTEARRHRVDGIICGHIHHAVIHDRLGLRYMNCGDWVESCTAIVETEEGAFEVLRWPEPECRARAPAEPANGVAGRLGTGRAVAQPTMLTTGNDG